MFICVKLFLLSCVIFSIILLGVQHPLIVLSTLLVLVLSVIFTEIPYRIVLFFMNPRPYVQAVVHPFKRKIIWRMTEDAEIPDIAWAHENCHLEQVERYGSVGFLIRIIWYFFIYGHKNSPLEVEARKAEEDVETAE